MKDTIKKPKGIPLSSNNSVINIEAPPIKNNCNSKKFNISRFFHEIFQNTSKNKSNASLSESKDKRCNNMIDSTSTSYEPLDCRKTLTSPTNSKNLNKKFSSNSSLNAEINSTHSGTSGQKSLAKSSYSTGERKKPKLGYKSLKLSPKEVKHPLRIKKNFSYFRLDNLLNLKLQNADNFNLENISLNGVTIGQFLPSSSKKSDHFSSLTEKGESDPLDKPTNSKMFNEKHIHNSSAIYDSNMSIFPWTLSKLKSMKEMGKTSESNWSSIVFDAYDEPQSSNSTKQLLVECPLCVAKYAPDRLIELYNCGHKFCLFCLKEYFKIEITEGRISLGCPQCSEPVHPSDVYSILNNDTSLINKYEAFTLRRFLVLEPDARWCPAPDCGYAVIASGCASCPMLKCERPGCNTYFCYHCKNEWHPNLTCDAAKSIRFRLSLPHPSSSQLLSNWETLAFNSLNTETNIKICPRCQAYIMKMDDGSCNHMTCAICGAEFCWLCMKEISDLHYLSPSGCTFWGKKPWSKKKKILWQLGTLVGAPMGIALIASIAIPAIIIGVPIFVGRKIYTKYKKCKALKRNTAMICGILASIVLSPVLACLAVSIGVPILLAYVYGVVPFSLCQNGIYGPGTGGASNSSRSRSTTMDTNQSPGSGVGNDMVPPTSQTIVLPVGGGDKGCGGSQSSRPSPTVIITLNQSASVAKPKRRTMNSWVDRLVSFASQSTTTRNHVTTTTSTITNKNSSRNGKSYFSLSHKNNVLGDAFIASPPRQLLMNAQEVGPNSGDAKACTSIENYLRHNFCDAHSYSDDNPSIDLQGGNGAPFCCITNEPSLLSDFSSSIGRARASLSAATSGSNLDRSVIIGGAPPGEYIHDTLSAPLALNAHNPSVSASSVAVTSEAHCTPVPAVSLPSTSSPIPAPQNSEKSHWIVSDSTDKYENDEQRQSPQPAFKIEVVRAEISHHDEDLKEELDLEGLKDEMVTASKVSVNASGRARRHSARGRKNSRGSWSGGSEASACSDKSSSAVLSLLTTDDGASSLRAMAGSIALNREMDEASITALAGSIIGVQMSGNSAQPHVYSIIPSEILHEPKTTNTTTAEPIGTMPRTIASHYSTADLSCDSCSFLSYPSHQGFKTIGPDTLSRLSVPPGSGDGEDATTFDHLSPKGCCLDLANDKNRTLTPQSNEQQSVVKGKTVDTSNVSK